MNVSPDVEIPIIYNIFPRLLKDIREWPRQALHARDMGFNSVYINPFHYPGFSGSLYAIKDFRRLNPIFLPADFDGDEMDLLTEVITEIRSYGMSVIMDLVINHTAKDSELIAAHKEWFKQDDKGAVVSPSAIDPADARRVTVWGDLAEIDNEESSDKQNLWDYWVSVMKFFIDIGFNGFRCDAAYKVPAELWSILITEALKQDPEILFLAETLGCRLQEVRQLESAGFHYFYNSSKWWNFDQPWCLEQHEMMSKIAPSISFPESHDTDRLFAECGRREQVMKQRYAFAAFFSAGLMIPIGFEYGFTKSLNVVHTTADDWEDSSIDLTGFIARVNSIKKKHGVLMEEGHLKVLNSLNEPILVLLKESNSTDEKAIAIINKDWHNHQRVYLSDLNVYDYHPFEFERIQSSEETLSHDLDLMPAEVIFIFPIQDRI